MNNYLITPDSDIILLKCPLEMDQQHTFDFANATAQYNYFYSLPKLIMDDATYMRKDGRLYFEGSFDTCITYNYCMYKNTNYSDKWFYAFVSDIRFESNNSCSCDLITDVFQTWMFDYTLRPSFIERMHVPKSTDNIGQWTFPEDFETGDYISNNYQEVSELKNQNIVVGTTLSANSSSTGYISDHVSGIYQNTPCGCAYYFAPRTDVGISYINEFLQDLTDDSKQDAITSLFLAPEWLCTTTDTNNLKRISNSTTVGTLTYSLTNGVAGLDSYIPSNNKLYTYPYYYTQITNGAGGNMIIKPELWNSRTHEFRIYASLTPGCSIIGVPLEYDGYDIAWEHALPLGKYPQLNYSTDQYTNWLTQNGLNNKIQTASGWLNIIKGDFALTNAIGAIASSGDVRGSGGDIKNAMSEIGGGVMQIANAMNEKYLAHKIPPQFDGNTNSGDIWSSNNEITYRINYMSIRREYARRIDKYFDFYGYRICDMSNMLTNPTKTRSNWNFIKTLDVNITGDIPEGDMQRLKALFNNGFTIWHTTQYFMDYTQANN